jgi:tetratricopeptide (TPR) repeat protein
MKSIGKLIIFIFTFLTLTASVSAQSPREQLQQMVEQLQKTPTDNALREKSIKLGAEIKPAPTISEEARRSFVEGVTIVKSAKEPSSQKLAIESFTEALKIAPWWGDAYYNLAVTQELTGQLDDAERTLKWFILSNPGESDARDAQDRIYAIAAKRKLAVAEAAAKREQENSPQAREAALLQNVEGAKFVNDSNKAPSPHFSYSEILEIKDRTLYKSIQIYSMGNGNQRTISFQDHDQPGLYSAERASYHDSAFTVTS